MPPDAAHVRARGRPVCESRHHTFTPDGVAHGAARREGGGDEGVALQDLLAGVLDVLGQPALPAAGLRRGFARSQIGEGQGVKPAPYALVVEGGGLVDGLHLDDQVREGVRDLELRAFLRRREPTLQCRASSPRSCTWIYTVDTVGERAANSVLIASAFQGRL